MIRLIRKWIYSIKYRLYIVVKYDRDSHGHITSVRSRGYTCPTEARLDFIKCVKDHDYDTMKLIAVRRNNGVNDVWIKVEW